MEERDKCAGGRERWVGTGFNKRIEKQERRGSGKGGQWALRSENGEGKQERRRSGRRVGTEIRK